MHEADPRSGSRPRRDARRQRGTWQHGTWQHGASGHRRGDGTAPAAHHDWDLSWTTRVATATTHKQVFDAPEIADGTGLHQLRMFYVNYKEVYNSADADLGAILVVRHIAIPMVLNDAMWAKYRSSAGKPS